MADAGFDPDAIVMERVAMARYAEQFMQELLLPIPSGKIDDEAAAGLQDLFVSEYSRLYGDAAVAVFQAIEIFAIRISANLPLGFAPLMENGASAGGGESRPDGRRDVYWPDGGGWVSTDLYGRAPAPGETIAGPAIVQLPHTGVAVAPGQSLTADAVGSLVINLS
jgi:N-methylhydantoinase A